jgi:hypothetical protein
MRPTGLIIVITCLMLSGSYSFAIEQKSSVKPNAQKAVVETPLAQETTAVIVKCPPKAGVKTYGDGGWAGVDHANAYALKSNSVSGNRAFCTYAGPQGFDFDLSLVFTYKSCVASPGGVFECRK